MKHLFVLFAGFASLLISAEFLIDYQVSADKVISGRVHDQQVTLRQDGRMVICRLRDIRPDEKTYVVLNLKGEDPNHNLDMIKVMPIDGVGKLFIFYRDIDVRPVYKEESNRVVKWKPAKSMRKFKSAAAGPVPVKNVSNTAIQLLVGPYKANVPPEPVVEEEPQEDVLLECWHGVVYLVDEKDGDYAQGVCAFRSELWDEVFGKESIWGGYHFAVPDKKDEKTIDIHELLRY